MFLIGLVKRYGHIWHTVRNNHRKVSKIDGLVDVVVKKRTARLSMF
jgi:hypothetical protein